VVTCNRHPFAPEPACCDCYPSAAHNGATPAEPDASRAAETTPAPPRFTETLTAREALELELVQRLHELPLELTTPAAHELARVTFERAANWFFWAHTPRPPEAEGFASSSSAPSPLELISTANMRHVSQDELEQVARLYEGNTVIPIRAFLNFVADVAAELELEPVNVPAIVDRLRAVVSEAGRSVRRIVMLRDAVRSFGIGGVTRDSRAREILAEDDKLAAPRAEG
jgi:hypothetical protein